MLNATITAVRFFFGVRLDRADALAEAAALLVLQKKAQAIWGDGEDD